MFFVLYVLLGVYFVTNLVLAVVYDSFKSEVRSSIVLLQAIGNHCHHVIVYHSSCFSCRFLTLHVHNFFSFGVACKTSG